MKKGSYVIICLVFMLTLALMNLVSTTTLATPPADSFHFTITSDMHNLHAKFGDVLQAISDGSEPGVFHVSIGDIGDGDTDESIAENRAQVDDKFGTTTIWYTIVGNHDAETAADMNWM